MRDLGTEDENDYQFNIQYALNLKSMPKLPAHKTIFQPKYSATFANKPFAIPYFGHSINNILVLEDIPTIELSDIAEDQEPDSSCWHLT